MSPKFILPMKDIIKNNSIYSSQIKEIIVLDKNLKKKNQSEEE